MSDGLKKTFALLSKTKNEAATRVLVPALDSARSEIQEGALRAILDRRSPVGQREILRRLHKLDQRWRAIIEQKPGRMSQALRDGLLGSSPQMCANACKAILWLHEYDLAPALITALEDPTNPNADLAAQTLLSLANLLYEELTAPRDYSVRRDPQIARRHVIGALEESVKRFARHKRSEVVVSFLILINRDNATLGQILLEPNHASYLALLEELNHGEHGGVIRLLLSYLDDPHPPSAALHVLSRRSDAKFVQHLLAKYGEEQSAAAKLNLKRIENFAWIGEDLSSLEELNEEEQRQALRLLVASGVSREVVFRAIVHLLSHGQPAGRRAAAAALSEFPGAEANSLVLAALEDEDPEVQAHVLRQFRHRGIAGALQRLIEMLDSPHEVVRQAARENLGEFSFPRFIAAYETLEDRARKSTGMLVKKVDPETPALMVKELHSPSRTRRLRALDIARTIRLVEEIEGAIIRLLDDDDYVVRIEAAEALAQSASPRSRAALEAALVDKSVLVQEAVERSLQTIDEQGARTAEADEAVAPQRLEEPAHE